MKNEDLLQFIKSTEEPMLPNDVTENAARDFKRQWSTGKAKSNERAESLKDIIAFANTNGKELSCIYVGIDEQRGDKGQKTGRFVIVGIEENALISGDDVKNILKDSIYPKINVDILTVQNLPLQKRIQVIAISENAGRPYMLSQTVRKGGEFVEGSKFHRVMDSSVRVSATEEDSLVRRWQRDDETYRRTRLDTFTKRQEAIESTKREVKWDAKVKNASTHQFALLITRDRLQRLHDFLSDTFETIGYSVKTQDNTEIAFPSFDKLLNYTNPTHKSINTLNIEALSCINPPALMEIQIKEGTFPKSTSAIKIYCDEVDWAIQAEQKVLKIIKEFRPWYWWTNKVSFTMTVPLIGFLYLALYLISLIRRQEAGHDVPLLDILNNKETTTGNSVLGFLILFVFFFIGSKFENWKTYVFPQIFFCIGEQVREFKKRQWNLYINGIATVLFVMFLISKAIQFMQGY